MTLNLLLRVMSKNELDGNNIFSDKYLSILMFEKFLIKSMLIIFPKSPFIFIKFFFVLR